MADNFNKNIFGEEIETCSKETMTGYLRNGSCETIKDDIGSHTVCAIVTDEFLEYSRNKGNDLITPRPELAFPGLKDGDSWCVCAGWYARALEAGKGCPIYLKKTHKNTLKLIPIETLKKFAIDLS